MRIFLTMEVSNGTLCLKVDAVNELFIGYNFHLYYKSWPFVEDNNFAELKEAELIRERINTVAMVEPFIGKYFSQEWVKKKILYMTDEEIGEMQEQIEEENANMQAQGIDPATGQPMQQPMMPQDQMQQPQDMTRSDDQVQSPTPDLDADVLNFSKNINKK